MCFLMTCITLASNKAKLQEALLYWWFCTFLNFHLCDLSCMKYEHANKHQHSLVLRTHVRI